MEKRDKRVVSVAAMRRLVSHSPTTCDGAPRRWITLGLGWLILGACGGPAAPTGGPPRPNAAIDGGAPSSSSSSSAPAPPPSAQEQRFLEPNVAASWTFPDGPSRKDRAQRLAAKLSTQLDSEYDRATTGMGVAFALVIDGEIVLVKAKGLADLENKRVATPDTIFRIASVTKTFTATSVMMLRDEGKLQLGDPLSVHLPELDVAYPHRDNAPIRVENMLTHSAGLMRSGPYAELTRPSTEADLIEAMKLPLTSDPALGHKYSNLGFGLLGLVVTRKSKMPYRDFVRSRLLEPLGMTSSGFDLTKLPPDKLAVGYRHDGAGLSPLPMTANGAGESAGGLYASARDMAAWIRMNLAAWPPRNDAEDLPVRRSTLREMHLPHLPFAIGSAAITGQSSRANTKSVGLAWEVLRGCYFERLVGHDGDLDGFHARLRFDADRNVGFVLLGNSDAGDMTGVAERMLDTIATEDLLAARRREPAPDLIERTKEAVKRIGSGAWTSDDHDAMFAERFRSQFTLAEATSLGARIAKDAGACTYTRAENVIDGLDAELVFRCTKGVLRASSRGTGTPLRLFGFKVDVMTPADSDQIAVAKEIVLRMRAKDDAALAATLKTKAVGTTSKMLQRAGAEAGACTVDGGDVSPWTRSAVFRLSCAKTKGATLRIQQRDSGSIDVLAIDTPVKCLR